MNDIEEIQTLARQFCDATDPRDQARIITQLLTLAGNGEQLLDEVHRYTDELLFRYAEQREWDEQLQFLTDEDLRLITPNEGIRL